MQVRKDSFRYATALILLWISCPLCAQVESSLDQETPRQIQEKLPAVIYTPDEEGKPSVALVPFPWEQVNEFLKRSRADDEPRYELGPLQLSVNAATDHATVTNSLTIRILKGGVTVVPIKMGSAHLSVPTADKGRVGARLNEDFGEWELILEGEKGDEFKVTFDSLVNLKRIGSETHLRLQLPRALQSELSVRVPFSNAEGRLLSGGVLTSVPKESKEDSDASGRNSPVVEEPTEFVITGLASELDFVWFPKSERSAVEELSFEVEGDIEVEVDALGGITADAMLTVTSFNKPIESLIVKLPENTRLSDNDADFGDYQVTVSETKNPKQKRREVRVAFAEPSLKPPSIRIKAKAEQELGSFELAGFQVLAVNDEQQTKPTSESGIVSVVNQGTRRLQTEIGTFARRISGNSTGQSRSRSTFEYSRPDQIQLLISRPSAELVVEPTYLVEIEESAATLIAIFRCSKGNPNSLVFDLGEWINSIEVVRDPDNVVDEANIDEQLEIALTNTPDNFEVAFRARMQFVDNLDASGTIKTFSFPVPNEAQRVLQSSVVIYSAGNTIVSAQSSNDQYTEIESTDVLETYPEELKDTLSPLCFRMRTIAQPADFSVFAAKLNRVSSVECDIELTDLEVVDETKIKLGVQQTLRWNVQNMSLPHALLKVPRSIFQTEDGNANLQVSVDGESRLSKDLVGIPDFLDPSSDNVSVRVDLKPQLGAFEIELTYDWFHEDEIPQRISERLATTVDLPLVLPRRLSSTSELDIVDLTFRRPRFSGYSITLAQSLNAKMGWPWLGSTDVVNLAPGVEAFLNPEAPKIPSSLPVEIRPVEVSEAETDFDELVDRAWFQTWLTDSTRTDRAVFRVKGGGGDDTIRIRMPSTNVRRLYVFVDGQRVEVTRDGEAIELDVPATNESRVIELQYWFDSRNPPGLLSAEIPQIDGADILGQWYWHIVMPRNECMVTWPRTLTRAHRWDWSVLIPRRQPELTLEELEEWSGATLTGDRVLAGSTEYLFGAMGDASTLSIRTTLLPIYVLALAGSVFLFGLLLLYYRRKALTLLAAGTMVASLIFLHPSYASIAGQVAVFGILLVLVMTLLRWLTKQTAVRRINTSFNDSGFELTPQRGSSVVTAGTTTLAAGSSRIAQPES